jgi:hypothetical protein
VLPIALTGIILAEFWHQFGSEVLPIALTHYIYYYLPPKKRFFFRSGQNPIKMKTQPVISS